MNGKLKKGLIGVAVLAIAGAAYYWGFAGNSAQAATTTIGGTGSIEADQITITAETGGRIIAIHADEGDNVKKGEMLVEIDRSIVESQRGQALAAVETAKANLDNVTAPARDEEVAAAEAQLSQAIATRDGLKIVWQQLQATLNNPLELNTRVDSAQGQLAILEKQVESAQAAVKTAEVQRDEISRNQNGDEAITMSQAAKEQYEAAKANLATKQAELSGAQENLNQLKAIRKNPLTLKAQVHAAQTGYEQADSAVMVLQAKLDAVKAPAMAEDVAIAEAQVKQAEAAVARLDVQLSKLTLSAPRGGVITERPANSGELAAPGDTLMKLGDLDKVTLKVYLPEEQMGRVRVGQKARVTIDAYPGESFEGAVTYINPEAEYTPKNVETKDQRVKLVFAVKISLQNPEHRLKIGMPAEAVILSDL
jgi:HlyD family secretion protein